MKRARITEKLNWIILGALLVINVLLYFQPLSYGFLKDDYQLIVDNKRINSSYNYLDTLDDRFFATHDYPYLKYWRPLVILSFYLDYALWDLNPTGFHATNIFIHAINCGLIFIFLILLTKNRALALMAALFFSIHPAHSESVAWISGRTDIVATLFILLSMISFVKFLQGSRGFFYIASFILFGCSILSKENSLFVTIFFIGITLYHYPRDYRRLLKLISPFFILMGTYIVIHVGITEIGGVAWTIEAKDFIYLPLAIGAYTKIILFPYFPAPHFSMDAFGWDSVELWFMFFVALSITAVLWRNREKFRHSLFFLLFMVFLIPVIFPPLVLAYPQIAFRFVYISVAWGGIFLYEVYQNIKKRYLKSIAAILIAIVFTAWIGENLYFQGFFKNDKVFYGKMVVFFPEEETFLLSLAEIEYQEGHAPQALMLVNRAINSNKANRWGIIPEEGVLFKGFLLVLQGNLREAESIAHQILQKSKNPQNIAYCYNILAKVHEMRGEYRAALDFLKKSGRIQLHPNIPLRQSMISIKLNEFGHALKYLEQAKIMNPALKDYSKLKKFILSKLGKDVK